MHTLRKLVRELHRRSVWQVAAMYLVVSWVVLEAVGVAVRYAGLPEWSPRMALVLLAVGLPVVLATAVVQRGVPWASRDLHEGIDPFEVVGRTPAEVHVIPERHPLHGTTVFTWRNAILGGVGAATLFMTSVVAYMGMWALGIGPMGSLVAQGLVEPGERVVVTDFVDAGGGELGGAVTEALRLALEGGLTLGTLPPGAETLGDARLVLGGDVALGEGEVRLRASLRDRPSGRTLATFRAASEDLPGAAHELAVKVRQRGGESLKSIREEAPLASVAPGGPDDFRLLHRVRGLMDSGDPAGAVALLEEAVASRPAFPLAWRELGPAYEAVEDSDAALRAYRRVLDLWPGDDRRGQAARAHAQDRIRALGG